MGLIMDFTVLRKKPLRVYREAERTLIQVPSEQAQLVRRYLESQGVPMLSQRSLMMGVHVIEISTDVDLKAVQLLLDTCSRAAATGEGL